MKGFIARISILFLLVALPVVCHGQQSDSAQMKTSTVPGNPDKPLEAVIPDPDSSSVALNSAMAEETRLIKRLAFDLAFENYRYRTGRQTDVYEFAFQLYLDNLRVQETQLNMTATLRSMVSDLKHMRSQAVDKVLKKYGL
jgi:hypothetical protein